MPSIRQRRGFTVAESLLASVILAIAVIAVAATLSASHQNDSSLQVEAQAASLSRQLMEEIAAKPLVLSDTTAGWPANRDRRDYDTVNDYAGYTERAPFSLLGGRVVNTDVPLERKVALIRPDKLFGTTLAPGDFVIVKVATLDAKGRGCVLHRLVTRTTISR